MAVPQELHWCDGMHDTNGESQSYPHQIRIVLCEMQFEFLPNQVSTPTMPFWINSGLIRKAKREKFCFPLEFGPNYVVNPIGPEWPILEGIQEVNRVWRRWALNCCVKMIVQRTFFSSLSVNGEERLQGAREEIQSIGNRCAGSEHSFSKEPIQTAPPPSCPRSYTLRLAYRT